MQHAVVITKIRSRRPEVLLRKGVLKIYSKFTREHPCRSVISIKLQRYGCSPVNLMHVFRATFLKSTSDGCFCKILMSIQCTKTRNHSWCDVDTIIQLVKLISVGQIIVYMEEWGTVTSQHCKSDFILKPMMVWQQQPRIQQLKIDPTLKTVKNLFNNINENRRIFWRWISRNRFDLKRIKVVIFLFEFRFAFLTFDNKKCMKMSKSIIYSLYEMLFSLVLSSNLTIRHHTFWFHILYILSDAI